MFTFNHFNFNVLDLERSVRFYHDALGLEPVRTKDAADGSFLLGFSYSITQTNRSILLLPYVPYTY